MNVAWTEDLATDITTIDRDHRRILTQLSALLPTIDARRVSDKRVLTLLGGLERYVVDHVAHEEEELWAVRFPGVYPHIAEHARLTEYLASVRQQTELRGPDPVVLRRHTRTLANWIIMHIHSADREFSQYLREVRAA